MSKSRRISYGIRIVINKQFYISKLVQVNKKSYRLIPPKNKLNCMAYMEAINKEIENERMKEQGSISSKLLC